MNNKYIMIKIKDICYYDNDFEFEPIIVKVSEDFEEKYKQLLEISKTYEDFEEINDFIEENFETLDYETRIINI